MNKKTYICININKKYIYMHEYKEKHIYIFI